MYAVCIATYAAILLFIDVEWNAAIHANVNSINEWHTLLISIYEYEYPVLPVKFIAAFHNLVIFLLLLFIQYKKKCTKSVDEKDAIVSISQHSLFNICIPLLIN